MSEVIRFISIDDHPAISEALGRVAEQYDDLEMVGSFRSIESVPRPCRIPGAVADLAIVDLSLPGVSGVAGIRAVAGWGLRVVAFTATAHERTAHDVLDAGAAAVVGKSVSTLEVLDAVRRVMSGDRFTVGVEPVPQLIADLTPAEEFLIRCLTTESRSTALARLTGVSEATVDNRISTLYDKAGLVATDRTRARLANWAEARGYST